ncbi:hypothetical protein B0T11DRAFT_293887 [Plectosphaerella cucumerina]|uniref:Uncharacterized protein n=1 Tax=Plectosphaerella cucumerina TaxID=40658 RepID=A0A8K0TVW2_9PEZI|nr:hypothetical protein B0T11DRAFT_293887 [Plectosphaerella cucumerina]
MLPTTLLSTLLALAATAVALPTLADGAAAEIVDRDTSDSKLAERQKNPNCFGGGYFECVNMHNFACNAGCIGAHGAAKISYGNSKGMMFNWLERVRGSILTYDGHSIVTSCSKVQIDMKCMPQLILSALAQGSHQQLAKSGGVLQQGSLKGLCVAMVPRPPAGHNVNVKALKGRERMQHEWHMRLCNGELLQAELRNVKEQRGWGVRCAFRRRICRSRGGSGDWRDEGKPIQRSRWSFSNRRSRPVERDRGRDKMREAVEWHPGKNGLEAILEENVGEVGQEANGNRFADLLVPGHIPILDLKVMAMEAWPLRALVLHHTSDVLSNNSGKLGAQSSGGSGAIMVMIAPEADAA